jgi:hypothetical protein
MFRQSRIASPGQSAPIIVSLNETPRPAIRADAALKPSVFELFAGPMKIVQKVKVPLQR